jgi:hypothetical protein
MAYDEEQQRKSRVVVQTPTSRREVVHTATERYPERRGGVSTGVVATVAIAAIALTAIIVYFLMNNNNAANDNTNVRVAATQPTPVQPQQPPVIIQQPAPAPQQAPVIVQQPAAAPPQTVVVPGPSTSTSTTAPGGSSTDSAPRSNVPDDSTIQSSIDTKLSKDQTFSTLGITATVMDGKVTLIGTVDTPELKRQAESLVRNVKGVKRVDNQIIVSGGTD